MIGDLTKIAKTQKQEIDLAKTSSFGEVLADVKQDLYSFNENSDAIVTTNFDIEEVLFQKKNLRIILYNLVYNALKYRSTDRPSHIFISTRIQADFLLLTVHNNGLGIRESQQVKAF